MAVAQEAALGRLMKGSGPTRHPKQGQSLNPVWPSNSLRKLAEKDHATCCFLNCGTDLPNEEWAVLISVKRFGLTKLLESGLLLPTPGS